MPTVVDLSHTHKIKIFFLIIKKLQIPICHNRGVIMTEFKLVHTICPYCGCGCGVDLVVKDGKLAGSHPFKRHPINEGKTCIKGNYCYEFVHDEKRLKKPLIKKDGKFVEASWDEALALISKKLSGYTSDEVGFFSSARCTNEDNYVFQKFARAVMKTNNIDHCARI